MTGRLVNGIAADYVPLMDRGLHYGDGVFETIACVHGRPQFLPEHLERMRVGAARLCIPFPEDTRFIDDIASLQQQAGVTGDCVFKLMLTRGAGSRGYRYDPRQPPMRISLRSAWPAHVSRWKQGIRTRFCETPVSVNPRLAGIKHLNRLDNVLAGAELGPNHEEGFMMDAQHHVIEGTVSNVFAVIDDVLVTPDLTNCGIRGIIRSKLLELAAQRGLMTAIRAIEKHELSAATEVFVCNSLLGVCPVTQLDGLPRARGEITRRLALDLEDLLKNNAQAAE